MKMTYSVESSMPLKEYLKSLHYSRKFIRAIKMHKGKIEVNGTTHRMNDVVVVNDQIEVTFPEETIGRSMDASPMTASICYEDDYFLVVEKPAGIPCIPNSKYRMDTLANQIIGYYQTINLSSTVHLVSRLDKETSGLVLIAKHRLFHHLMSEDLKKVVNRSYLAYVSKPLNDQGTIILPIEKIGSEVKRIIKSTGKYACTQYQAESHGNMSVIRCQLETGRTHQIRIHLSSIGYPIIGDTMYDSPIAYSRHLLHSDELRFYHPVKQEWIEVKSDVSLEQLANQLTS